MNLRRLIRSVRSLPPQILLALLVLAAAGVSALVQGRDGGRSSPPLPAAGGEAVPEPDRAEQFSLPIEQALDAARRGDLDGYLSQFAPPLRGELERVRAEKGDEYLRDYLRRLAAPLKGLAVDLAGREIVDAETARLQVEFVYADRNEVQPYLLRRQSGRWRISRVEQARFVPTLIPYGTPLEELDRKR